MEKERPVCAEDEIDLYDYYLVIRKRFKLILGIFVLAVISAGVLSFMMTPIYKVSASITPGWFEKPADGKITYVDSPENILSSINNGSYTPGIVESLELPESYLGIGFSAKVPKKSEIINIRYLTPDPEQGKLILGELINQIKLFYEQRIAAARQLAENSAEQLANLKTKILGDMALERKKLALLKDSEETLRRQIKEIGENTKAIVRHKDTLAKKGANADTVALLLYSNTLQQNIAYMGTLNSNIANRLDQESAKNRIKQMKIEFMNATKEIEAKKLEKNMIAGIRIIQKPTASLHPVEMKKKRNVALAGIVSLFFGTFLAFFMEWLDRNRKRKLEQA